MNTALSLLEARVLRLEGDVEYHRRALMELAEHVEALSALLKQAAEQLAVLTAPENGE